MTLRASGNVYTMVSESHVTNHGVLGRSNTTVCGKLISWTWPHARGIMLGEQLMKSAGLCVACRVALEKEFGTCPMAPSKEEILELLGRIARCGSPQPCGHAWHAPNFSKAEWEKIEMFRDQIASGLLDNGERLYQSATRFCEELQEDADGVPQDELLNLHAALDAIDASRRASSEMESEQWEYRVWRISVGIPEQELNRHGNEGWELVTLWFKSSSDITAFFKRRHLLEMKKRGTTK